MTKKQLQSRNGKMGTAKRDESFRQYAPKTRKKTVDVHKPNQPRDHTQRTEVSLPAEPWE